jgi:hypothetical protein
VAASGRAPRRVRGVVDTFIGLISAVLVTCIALFAIGIAIAFRPAPHSWLAPSTNPLKDVDFDNTTLEERRRLFDSWTWHPSGLVLSQPNARTSAIGVDELDAGSLKGTFYNLKRWASLLTGSSLKLVDGDDTDPSMPSKVLLFPIQKAPRRPALLCCDHF